MTRMTEGRPIDATSEERIRAHQAEYGEHAIDYDKALDLAISGVMNSEPGGDTPRDIVRMNAEEAAGHPLSKEEVDELMRKLVAGGTFELMGVGEINEVGDDPKKNWVFEVDVDTGTDHGFWAAVDRDTGEVQVSGFN